MCWENNAIGKIRSVARKVFGEYLLMEDGEDTLIWCISKFAFCHATVISWVHCQFLLPVLLGIVLTSREIPYSLTNEAYNDWGDWRGFGWDFLGRRKAHLFEIVLNRIWGKPRGGKREETCGRILVSSS